jgi:hypothetical protein
LAEDQFMHISDPKRCTADPFSPLSNWKLSDEDIYHQELGEEAETQADYDESMPASMGEALNSFIQLEPVGLTNENIPRYSPVSRHAANRLPSRQALCALSDITAREYARSTMTQNLIRIYHDSMENALSCWLTERNCPYSRIRDGNLKTTQSEWGPKFSNRICTRVCRLDYAASSIRGRSLSVVEDKKASQALHKSIMAFASQWAQNFHKDSNNIPSNPLIHDEKSFRESLWNDAKHTLETSVGIPSFRVVFANILFSLTQRPIKDEEEIGLDELLEKDLAHIFLENAVRQMFSFRYKAAQIRSGADRNMKLPERTADTLPTSTSPNLSLYEVENHDTFDLLFWLGVMFDTQIAAMHQRPPVVSDEDSQKASDSGCRTSFAARASSFDLDGFSLSSRRLHNGKQDLWGDFLLQKPAGYQTPEKPMPTWPFSHEEAAEILSDAAPVKVLLWRRITQLQTLIYREADPELIEEGIQKALLVYRHWNNTYNIFILNCVSNHATLPPRVQSWYVVLAAHWHLGAMLLADVIENIDQTNLSLKHQRESRNVIQFPCSLKRDNASAVATLAQCSIYEDEMMKPHPSQFHDSFNDAAFLTEPFTVLLINSFAKSGYILLENMQTSLRSVHCGPSGSFNQFRQGCEVCIRALLCLGRKSDMASLVGRGLSNKLKSKLQPESINQSTSSLDMGYLAGMESYSWDSDPAFDWGTLHTMNTSNDLWI